MEPILPSIPEAMQRDIEHATMILKTGGCQSVFLFGSAATGTMHADSDLDLAVRGCPPQQFFHLLGRLLSDLEHAVDLVDLDVPSPFVEFLLTKGKLVQLG
jgi:predicted nucleotidyltransferase